MESVLLLLITNKRSSGELNSILCRMLLVHIDKSSEFIFLLFIKHIHINHERDVQE